MNISGIFLIADVTGVTKGKLFKNLKSGDTFKVELELADPGHGRSVYATRLRVTNQVTGEYIFETLTNLTNRLQNFNLIQVA